MIPVLSTVHPNAASRSRAQVQITHSFDFPAERRRSLSRISAEPLATGCCEESLPDGDSVSFVGLFSLAEILPLSPLPNTFPRGGYTCVRRRVGMYLYNTLLLCSAARRRKLRLATLPLDFQALGTDLSLIFLLCLCVCVCFVVIQLRQSAYRIYIRARIYEIYISVGVCVCVCSGRYRAAASKTMIFAVKREKEEEEETGEREKKERSCIIE